MTPYGILANSSRVARQNNHNHDASSELALSLLISKHAYRSVMAVERLASYLKRRSTT